MKYKILKTVSEEVEVNEGFFKIGSEFFAIVGDKIISIYIAETSDYRSIMSQNITNASTSFHKLTKETEITKDDFVQAYEKAINYINEQIGLAL